LYFNFFYYEHPLYFIHMVVWNMNMMFLIFLMNLMFWMFGHYYCVMKNALDIENLLGYA
jgi:hypothetical protein